MSPTNFKLSRVDCNFIDFERNDERLNSKINFERNSVYTGDCYSIKIMDIKTLFYNDIKKKI